MGATQEAKAGSARRAGEGKRTLNPLRTAHPYEMTPAIEQPYRKPSAYRLELAATLLNQHAHQATLIEDRP
ncbi:hypothetical protein [Pseudomonas wenzhouensis]|uniref:hypothetical protein n=1 Tax=Pseudomonas wenzhouensis TaxID=2906062 RepID=UPI001E59C9F3|nr:hypothetical protein [Pseudomonas wenzhouensis]UFQ97616.1 hypothetical protein J7655_20545 [Pseudomonas wenzhouensis]